MQRYGLRIGNVGVEFPSIEDRNKALQAFTSGTDVIINSERIIYTPGEGNFSVYDRDTKDVITKCVICEGSFLQATCSLREYPFKNSWEKDWNNIENYICDACYAKQVKAEEIFKAKKLVENSENAS